MMNRNVAVIGGGASGMMAAIAAARAGAYVVIFEKNDRVGKKILATGNGKCNFSNRCMGAEYYYGSGSVRVADCLKRFGTEETIQFFEQLGMRIKDRNGYLYPESGQAATVLDLLRRELERLQIEVRTGSRAESIKKKGKKLEVLAEGRSSLWDAVIIACGGKAAPKTGSAGDGYALAKKLGHTICEPVPALTSLLCDGDFWKGIAGVRCEAKIELLVDGTVVQTQSGELQLTDYGVSGIPIFQLSREAAYALRTHRRVSVRIDFMNDISEEAYRSFWRDRFDRADPRQTMEDFMLGMLHKKLTVMLLKVAGIRADENCGMLSAKKRETLQRLCRGLTVNVRAANSFEQAQVTAGGIPFSEVSQELESLRQPGVFFSGEVLDIDGICGGYNLQWAWTSGTIAGEAAAGTGRDFKPKRNGCERNDTNQSDKASGRAYRGRAAT